MTSANPNRGEIWSVNLDPTTGREQAGIRPALVFSVDKFNHGPAELIVVLPITSRDKRQPMHVGIDPPEGGLAKLSFIKCEDIRSISKHRLLRVHGSVSAATMNEVEERVRLLLNL